MVKVIKNTPKLDKINKEIKYLQKHGIKVGVFGQDADKEQYGVKVKDYAVYLNYGTVFMPPRPFFDRAVKISKAQEIIKREEKAILKDVFLGNITGKQALNQLGIFIKQQIQEQIMNNNFTIEDSTKKRKKRNKNLVLRENDFLLNSIFFEIIKI